MGVNGRPMRACALSTESETPCCSDQLKESSAVHAKVAVATAIFPRLICFMAFLHYCLPETENVALAARGANQDPLEISSQKSESRPGRIGLSWRYPRPSVGNPKEVTLRSPRSDLPHLLPTLHQPHRR